MDTQQLCHWCQQHTAYERFGGFCVCCYKPIRRIAYRSKPFSRLRGSKDRLEDALVHARVTAERFKYLGSIIRNQCRVIS